ncbi:MAG: helix-hairpin-helix domain-containing protein, partial [Bacteroidaceae bacterium]|nr:helix-hairpin-helix domain-containing protein [Bacteroidaceae bacterium]
KWYIWDTVVITKTLSYTAKARPVSPLDLNAADSAALVMLPGIGPVFAARIIRYREQLGGFLDISQLTEINGLPDSLMKWFIIGDSIPLRPVAVNSASLSELRRHPYLNFYQSRAIVEYRRERGKIKGPDQLSFMEEFTARDLERLMPYLDFR